MPKPKAVKKACNPKDAIGVKKVPMSCLSSHALVLLAEAIQAEKVRPVDAVDIYANDQFNAASAHLMMFWEGQNDLFKIPHLSRAMARIAVLRNAEIYGTLEDDRLLVDPKGLHIAALNKAAGGVIEKLPASVAPFTHLKPGALGFKVSVPITSQTPFHVLPWRVVYEMALGMMEGGIKYGKHNYREVGVRASVYYDATMRHLDDWYVGKPIYHESGLSHLSKALSSSQVLLDSMVKGNWVDDRPIRI